MLNYSAAKDINLMTEEERSQHYYAVCKSLGLDPVLQLLQYKMMEKSDGSGQRHLVLYATKGATDALRMANEISVFKLEQSVVAGAVVFTAYAKNAAGREDIAVGSAYINGKDGRALENAITTAQTRASRRVTLQMVGCGLLDESEIPDGKTVSLNTAPVPLAVLGQPVPESSSAVGKDITLPSETKTEYKIQAAPPATIILPAPVGDSVKVVAPAAVAPAVVVVLPEEKKLPNPAAGLKPVALTTMAAPDGAPPAVPAEQTNAVAGPTAEQMTTRRKRRTKAEMEAARAADAAQAVVAEAIAQATPAPLVVVPASATEPAEVVNQPASDPSRTAPIIGTIPDDAQKKAYVDRLAAFRDKCTENGMVPSQGMGPGRKVREFCKIVNRGSELNNLTVEQWENTFRFLTDTVNTHGWAEMIKFMEQQIEQQAAVVA